MTIPEGVNKIGQYVLGFEEANYEERYVYGIHHGFRHDFHIDDAGSDAV